MHLLKQWETNHLNKKNELLKLETEEDIKALPLSESTQIPQEGKLNNNTKALLEEFKQQEKIFQEIEEETNNLLINIDLDQTEKRLKEQEEETAKFLSSIDQVCSSDINAKLMEMYKIADMDPNSIMPDIDTNIQTTVPIDEDADANNECMEWNVNDVISPDE